MVNPQMLAKTRTSLRQRFVISRISICKLLVADQANLGHAQALRAGHDHGDILVSDQLVGAQMHFRLVGLLSDLLKLVFEGIAVWHYLAVPQDGAVEVYVDVYHCWRRRRWCGPGIRHV